MTNDALADVLVGGGLAPVEIPGTDGGSILVVNAGARVLRLVGRSGRDFLWLNKPLFERSPTDLFGSPGWANLGGDRTWVAPESDVFVRDLRDPWGTYRVPAELDPGHYEMRRVDGRAHLRSSFELGNHRLGVRCTLLLEKTLSAAPNPFRQLTEEGSLRSAEYIGYDQTTTLRLLSDPMPGVQFGLWHLTQVPAVGEILVPVTGPDRPHAYFGPDQSDRLTLEPGLVRFRVDAAELHKIGIKAAFVIGRAGFLREDEDGLLSLLVRNFLANPSAEYVDAPWDDRNDRGYAVQCFCDDGKLGAFGELEYHTPGIGYGTGIASYTDTSQLWAFRGERPIIEKIARLLLAVDIQGGGH